MSFGSDISSNTLNIALAQSEAINVSDSQEGLQTPGQRPNTPPCLSTQSSTDASILDRTQENACAVEMVDRYRHQVLNTNGAMDSIPTFGKIVEGADMLNIYVRLLILQPGELLSKSVTNPYVVNSFILVVPNNFDRIWFKDVGFLTSLLQQSKTIVHRTFPFPHLSEFKIDFTLQPDSVLYSYPSSGFCLPHRINVKQLEDMDPDMRIEYMAQSSPPPIPYITMTGVTFHALYDIAFLCYGIQQKPSRTLPPNQNELLFLTELNILITTKLDAVATISKVLKLYHDYRNTMLRSHHRLPSSQPIFSKPTEPPRHQDTQPQPLQVHTIQPFEPTAPLQETIQQLPPGTPYIPPHLRTNRHRPSTEVQHNQTLPPNSFLKLPLFQTNDVQQQVHHQPIMVHQQNQPPIMIHQQQMQMAPMVRMPPAQQPMPPYMHRTPSQPRPPRMLRLPNIRPGTTKAQKHPRVQIIDGTIPWKPSPGPK